MAKRAPTPADMDDPEHAWREQARTLLRVEQRRQNLTYAEIAERMQAIGIGETEVSVRNKISRGTFPATFMLQFMHVLGIQLIPFKPQLTGEVTLPPELLGKLPQVRMTPELVAALVGTSKKE
ncbi:MULTISPECIES: DUF6471 domain-containing protein [Brevundimonas]|jgi:hypothetical protein|uniref:SANT/Myb-like DNA-binding domain-containing protein n=1 Tax=Brevundimonas albigilva TaxID=1312364 RepID=A0ABY4SNJ8_9CAUL|nr:MULTISPECIES: DUF6471 domain-containing protein [Brevundimonas]URI15823.1 SANT/Myb-like DNA-binding domain-containing protein [Brevundimonas albigilva]